MYMLRAIDMVKSFLVRPSTGSDVARERPYSAGNHQSLVIAPKNRPI